MNMNKTLMRVLCAIMAVVALFAMTACGGKTTETQPATTEATTAPATTEAVTVENTVTYFSMSMGENFETVYSLNVYGSEDGAYVEYITDEKKVGNFDATLFDTVAVQVQNAGLAELNGQDVYEDGEANASMYIEFADGTAYMANFGGVIPDAFVTAYNTMDAFFQTLDLEVYVPQPVIGEGVNETALSEMTQVLNNAGIPNVDAFVIADAPIDENFGFTMGLTATEGIVNGTSCTPMMMTTAYSFVIVTVEDETKIEAVAADFESNVDWRKWVCVSPTNALIAQKDNMVLCLIGADELYTGTADAVLNAGWTQITTLENPDL